jgi:hypothetical protein
MSRFAFALGNETFSDRRLLLCLPIGIQVKEHKETKRLILSSVKSLDDDDDQDLTMSLSEPASKIICIDLEDAKRAATLVGQRKVIQRIPVSSVLLASESRFFKSLLSNGMKETSQTDVILEVASEEEAALVFTLVRYLYTRQPMTGSLVDLLVQADKLGIDVAVTELARGIESTEMSVEACCAYLDGLPETVRMHEACRGLLTKARACLVAEFKVRARSCCTVLMRAFE